MTGETGALPGRDAGLKAEYRGGHGDPVTQVRRTQISGSQISRTQIGGPQITGG